MMEPENDGEAGFENSIRPFVNPKQLLSAEVEIGLGLSFLRTRTGV